MAAIFKSGLLIIRVEPDTRLKRVSGTDKALLQSTSIIRVIRVLGLNENLHTASQRPSPTPPALLTQTQNSSPSVTQVRGSFPLTLRVSSASSLFLLRFAVTYNQ